VFERVVLLQQRLPVPEDMPPAYASLMCACWAADPFARPTFAVVHATLSGMLRELPDAHERYFADL
jgi:hypothetical protein